MLLKQQWAHMMQATPVPESTDPPLGSQWLRVIGTWGSIQKIRSAEDGTKAEVEAVPLQQFDFNLPLYVVLSTEAATWLAEGNSQQQRWRSWWRSWWRSTPKVRGQLDAAIKQRVVSRMIDH